MPNQLYYPQGYCNTSATTNSTQYVPMWTSWSNNATIIQYQQGVPIQSYQPSQIYTYQTANTYSDEVWNQWVIMGNGTMTTSPQTTFHQETPEEIEARREEREREAQERAAARTRARVLLEDFLSDEQKVELERKGRFHVTGSKGRRYCIRTTGGQQGNVDLLKPDGSVQASLCCHPRGYLPDGDAWLMQMVELRHDEEHFLRTANVHRGSLPAAA
jgi:hypothetical protein